MKKIQITSHYFKWFFKIMIVVLVIFTIASWAMVSNNKHNTVAFLNLGFHIVPQNLSILSPITAKTRIIAFVISLIPLLIEITICLLLVSLFDKFEKLQLFAIGNVRIIKKIGLLIVAGQIILPFYEADISAILTWHNPAGKRMAEISFTSTNISILIIAFFMILIAWIMEEGCKLQEEQRYTI